MVAPALAEAIKNRKTIPAKSHTMLHRDKGHVFRFLMNPPRIAPVADLKSYNKRYPHSCKTKPPTLLPRHVRNKGTLI